MAVTAHKLGPGTLSFGDSGTLREFASKATNTRLTPTTEQEDPIPVLSGDEYQEEPETTSVIAGTFLQDYGSDALVAWCWEHKGEIMPFEFTPRSGQALTVSGQCQIQAVEIGGDVKTTNTTDFEFPVIGEPTIGTDGAAGASSLGARVTPATVANRAELTD